MVGRVLRQPNAQKIEDDETLNRCYIYCNRWEVAETLKAVRQGLKDEGLSNIKESIFVAQEGSETNKEKIIVKRREKHEGAEILLPRVLHKDEEKRNEWRSLNYNRDILALVSWENLDIDKTFPLRKLKDEDEEIREMNVQGKDRKIEGKSILYEANLQLSYFANSLRDIVPNPWQATRIAKKFINLFKAQGCDETTIEYHRSLLASSIATVLTTKIANNAKEIFEKKVHDGIISFHLKTNKKLNYEMKKSFEVFLTSGEDSILANKEGDSVQNSLFKPIYKHHFNGYEEDFALYLDSDDALEWWHRVASKQGYSLQGWRKTLSYPDFIAVRIHDKRLFIFETKGDQFEGSDDTNLQTESACHS